MARRKIELLRDAVVDAARDYTTCTSDLFRVWREPVDVLAVTRAGERLRDAVQAHDAHCSPITSAPGQASGQAETSMQAALSMIPHASSLRTRVAQEVFSVQFPGYAPGLTDADLEARLKGKHQTISSARNWLVLAGWLRDSGHRKPTPSGRKAVVWTLTPPALERLRRG